MGNVRTKYPLTSAKQSAERLSLIKIDEMLTLLTVILEKLDADVGVSDADYAILVDTVRTMQDSIGIRPEDFKI